MLKATHPKPSHLMNLSTLSEKENFTPEKIDKSEKQVEYSQVISRRKIFNL